MNRLVDSRDRHAYGRGEVGGAKDNGLQAWRRSTDFLHVDQAFRSLDLGLDADVAHWQPGVRFNLTQQEIERHDVRGASNLGQHDLVQALARVTHDLNDVAVGPRRVPRVHPHAQDPIVPGEGPKGIHHLGSSGHLLLRRDGVL